jgi:hypothetical protein
MNQIKLHQAVKTISPSSPTLPTHPSQTILQNYLIYNFSTLDASPS